MQLQGDHQDAALPVLKKILSTPGLKFEGFHFHLGSQVEDQECYAEAFEKLEGFILRARKEIGEVGANTIVIVGGLPVSYGRIVPTPKVLGTKMVCRLDGLPAIMA